MKSLNAVNFSLKKNLSINKNIPFVVLIIIYCFLCGKDLQLAVDAEFTVFEFVLYMTSDHYYLIYALFFIFLYHVFTSLKKQENIVLIRFKSLRQYYYAESTVELIRILLLGFIHFIIPVCISYFSLNKGNCFNGHNIDGYYNDTLEYVQYFKHYFSTPFEACMVYLIFMCLGLFFIYQLLFFVRQLKTEKTVILAEAFIIVNVMLGFKLFSTNTTMEFMFFNNYFILHHPLFSCGIIAVCANIIIMIVLSVALPYIAIQKKKYPSNIKIIYFKYKSYPKAFIIFGFSLVMASLSAIDNHAPTEYLYCILKGYSPKNFNLTELLYYIAFFVFPLVFINVVLEEENNNKTILFKYRFKNRKTWNRTLLVSIRNFILKYILIWNLTFVMFYIMICIISKDNGSDIFLNDICKYYDISEQQFYIGCAISIVLRILELFMTCSINILFSYILKNQTASFIITISGYSISVVLGAFSEKYNYLTFGYASLYNVLSSFGNWLLLIISTIISCCIPIIIYLIIRRLDYGKCN